MSTFSEIVNESLNDVLSEGYLNEAGERQFVSSEKRRALKGSR